MATEVTLLEEANLPNTEGTAAVAEDCEISHGATLGRSAALMGSPDGERSTGPFTAHRAQAPRQRRA
jgi:hypothetical protein